MQWSKRASSPALPPVPRLPCPPPKFMSSFLITLKSSTHRRRVAHSAAVHGRPSVGRTTEETHPVLQRLLTPSGSFARGGALGLPSSPCSRVSWLGLVQVLCQHPQPCKFPYLNFWRQCPSLDLELTDWLDWVASESQGSWGGLPILGLQVYMAHLDTVSALFFELWSCTRVCGWLAVIWWLDKGRVQQQGIRIRIDETSFIKKATVSLPEGSGIRSDIFLFFRIHSLIQHCSGHWDTAMKALGCIQLTF